MRWPAQCIVGNLVWSADDGRVWALWRIAQQTYEFLSDTQKVRYLRQLQATFIGLPAQSTLMSVYREIDGDELFDKMTVGLDETEPRFAQWFAAARRNAAEVDARPAYQRHLYLAVALDDPDDTKRGWLEPLQAAFASVSVAAGATPPMPSRRTIDNHQRSVARIEASIANYITLERATPADVRWIYNRSVFRGAGVPTQPEPDWNHRTLLGARHGVIGSPSVTQGVDARFVEGGEPADEHRPRHRRYLKVDTEDAVSYQTFHVMADMPAGWNFPGGGGEWFVEAARLPHPIDWTVHITAVPNQEAQAKARKKQRDLNAQMDEWEDDPLGAPKSLQDAIGDIEAERAELINSPAAPELHATVIFAVGAADLQELEERSQTLRSIFEAFEYQIPRPTGNQLQLFRSMLPGARTPPVCEQYRQVLMPRDLASGVPTAGVEVGDPQGMVFGRAADGGTSLPVLLDPAHGPAINRSGSMGLFGRLGSGKSYAVKRIAQATVARGGQVIAVDRTSSGEYVAFAEAMPGTVDTIRLEAGADVSIDPLLVFPDDTRVDVSISFLSLMCQVKPTNDDALVLGDCVRAVADRGGRLVDVIAALREIAAAEPSAESLARRIEMYAALELGRIVFATDRRPARWDADFVTIHTPNLKVPDREVLLNPVTAEQMMPEQVLAVAMLYLVTALARQMIFENPRRFAAALLDEVWWLTASMQGQALLLDGVRDGRKHNAAIWLISQTVDDIGDARLASLLGPRAVFAQGPGQGRRALEFCKIAPTPDLVELVEDRLGQGECLLRDLYGRIARVLVDPADAELHGYFDTNPVTIAQRQDTHTSNGAGGSRRNARHLLGV